jgi:hypothetical protein
MMTSVERKPFNPGQPVLVREIWQGKVWSARPEIIVQDTAELLVLYKASGTPWKQPVAPEGNEVTARNRKAGNWQLRDTVWHGEGNLRLTVPGSHFSVITFWNDGHDSLRYWYVNLEDPLHRTRFGFDYLDMILDVIVEANLAHWHWKDEDDFDLAQKLGLIPADRASFLRLEGERAVKMLQSGESIFNGWGNWRPDPSWQVPTLPEGWDIV